VADNQDNPGIRIPPPLIYCCPWSQGWRSTEVSWKCRWLDHVSTERCEHTTVHSTRGRVTSVEQGYVTDAWSRIRSAPSTRRPTRW
jgi:hypothetical protein